MKTYRVHGLVKGGKYLGEYEANSKEEAIEMALNSNEAHVSMCHQCSDQCEDPMIEEAFAETDDEEDND